MRTVVAMSLVLLMRLITGVKAVWVHCQPGTRQRIYFANHSSHLDGLVIWASLPAQLRARTHPVAARDYWGASAFRRYLAEEVFRAILIDRDGSRSARETIQGIVTAIGQQHSLILFPEGTRGDGQTLGAFKSGLYYLAQERPDIELVPVYLQNLSRVLPKGEVFLVPILCSAYFGTPLQLQPGEDREAFLARARNAVLALGGERHAVVA